MKNVLISGGAGFIGSNFVRHLLRLEPEARLHNLDALTYAGCLENLEDVRGSDRYTFIRGDICDEKLVVEILLEKKIDTVVHFAAESHVDRSISDPGPFMRTNVLGTFALLEAARRAWGEGAGGNRFLHISTDEVFGSLGESDPPVNETSPYLPRSPYSASKAAADHLARSYCHTYGLPVTITNCSNNYGPYQFPEKLIPLMILNALEGKPLPIYGDGKQIRDWLFVEDHCEALHLVLKKGRAGETYLIGGGNQACNLEVVMEICTILDELRPGPQPHSAAITHVEDRPGHDRRYALDTTKIHRELGWKPKHDLHGGLRETARWYLDHMDWVRTIQNRAGYAEWLEQNYAMRKK